MKAGETAVWEDRVPPSPCRPLRRQGPISEPLPSHMRPQLEMDTCLRRYLRNGGIRLIPPSPILASCPHRSRIRCRSGCGGGDRMGLAGDVRSCTAPGRSGQGEPRKLGWESASSGRTGVRPPRISLSCEKHGGNVRAAPVTKTRDLGPFRGVR